MAASAADDGERSSAAARLRIAWRVVRAAELLALAFLVSRSFPRLPYAAAAASSALRVAASLLLHPRSVFLIANAIVLLLFLFSRRDPSSSSSSSSPSSDQDHFLSFAGPQLLLPSAADSPALASGADAVFEDKQAVHVTTVRAAAPRRSRSEKIGGGTRRAGSPDMRRSESENGRRRRRSTSSVVPEEWGGAEDDDEEGEFRRAVEAFIAKQQTRFHREESFGLVAGDDAQAITVAPAVSPVK